MSDAPTARRNAVLDTLSAESLDRLLPSLHQVPLTLGTVLYAPGEPVRTIHFPLLGVVSIVTELEDEEVVEVATVGHEGVVGLPVLLGAETPTERAMVQVEGNALSMDADLVDEAAATDDSLHAALRRYTQVMFTQLARNSACNRAHTVRQRAARWLLTTADRMDGPTFDLTQHFLAQMLNVRRASVSQVARALADEGCIRYIRGTLTIRDRDQLHASACGCYDLLRADMAGATALH
ncbi:Crp/Fnr family transcriptional regulator [Kineococcus sp. NUM-3379]